MVFINSLIDFKHLAREISSDGNLLSNYWQQWQHRKYLDLLYQSSRSSGKKYEDSKPRLTSAEKRAKRRLGYEPPGQVRRNSFVEKLDKKDPEDQGRYSVTSRVIFTTLT